MITTPVTDRGLDIVSNGFSDYVCVPCIMSVEACMYMYLV